MHCRCLSGLLTIFFIVSFILFQVKVISILWAVPPVSGLYFLASCLESNVYVTQAGALNRLLSSINDLENIDLFLIICVLFIHCLLIAVSEMAQ